jgi:hypothetical protein
MLKTAFRIALIRAWLERFLRYWARTHSPSQLDLRTQTSIHATSVAFVQGLFTSVARVLKSRQRACADLHNTFCKQDDMRATRSVHPRAALRTSC